MRRSGFLLPALSMGLLYSSMYVGLIIINLRGSASDGRGDFGVLLHFALVALAALGLYFAAGKGVRWLRPLAALLALAGLSLMALPFLSGDLGERIFNGRPPLLDIGMAFFMPVALFQFFRTVPSGRECFFFALVMACGELLWALLFPLFGGVSAHPQGQQAFHLFSLCCWMVGGAGLCLGMSINHAARESVVVTPDAAAQNGQGVTARPGNRAALCLIFAAGAGVFGMMGLHMGMLMPKTAVMPELISMAHFVFLFLLPPVGLMLDENPARVMLMSIPALAAVFLLGLSHEYGLLGWKPLFYALNFMQQIMLLTAYTATAKLLKTRTVFPLLITLAHCLSMAHIGGVALGRLADAVPYGITAMSLLLTAGTAICLWRFRGLLTENTELWALPGQEDNPVPGAALPEAAVSPFSEEEARLAAFAASYSLSDQETQVIGMLAQDRSSEEIAEALDVKASTVRTYVRRLMYKSGTSNRAELLARYGSHDSA